MEGDKVKLFSKAEAEAEALTRNQAAARLAEEAAAASRPAASRLTMDCSEWAAANKAAHGGEVVYLKPRGGARLTGNLLGDAAEQGYQYHALVRRGGKLDDEFHPQGIAESEWLAQYNRINKFDSPPEFARYNVLDNVPPTPMRPSNDR